jgi:hypothetical protein
MHPWNRGRQLSLWDHLDLIRQMRLDGCDWYSIAAALRLRGVCRTPGSVHMFYLGAIKAGKVMLSREALLAELASKNSSGPLSGIDLRAAR